MTIAAQYIDADHSGIYVSLDEGDDVGGFVGPNAFVAPSAEGNREYDALMKLIADGAITIAPFASAPSGPPDGPTLGDWRVGLVLWTRDDGKGGKVTRLTDVMAAVQTLVASGNPLGIVAQERLEYSNNVQRSELLKLAPAFAFSPADVDESLYRAHQVNLGDLSGVWPLPAAS